MGPSDPEGAGPAAIAGRAAREVAAIRAALARIEDRLAEARPSAPDGGARLSEAMQALDHLRQTAGDLSTFLDRWAATLPEAPAVGTGPLVAGLALRDLGDRLAGRPADGPVRSGEVDLL